MDRGTILGGSVVNDQPETRDQLLEPRWPTVTAVAFLTLWFALLSLPMWSGLLLTSEWSDQYATGYAFRYWGASQWVETGRIPQWNPTIFGGLPFVAAQHGDIFYPTAWLRLLLPTVAAMNLGFVLHYVAAGFFTYLLLRLLNLTWTGAVVGGAAYQLSGVVASLVQPGHDGKVFVSTLLPLGLIGLVLAIKRRRWEGYGIVAVAVGCGLLAHLQMIYYTLIVAGVFTLYLLYGEPEERRTFWDGVPGLGFALGAVLLGFGIAMIQFVPFFNYIPFSPRAEGYYGFEGATSYAVPWSHVPEILFSGFAGSLGTYWGPNPLKLHSEYVGLPVVALAVLGALGPQKYLVRWLGGIGLLFFLVSLGAATPFYRLWWSVMPFMKQVRAPGMALFIVAFVLAVCAALGVERLERREGRAHVLAWLAAGAGVVILAVAGAFGALAEFLAQSHELTQGRPVADVARLGRGAVLMGGALSGAALLAAGAIAYAFLGRRIPAAVFGPMLALVIGADLWRNALGFWNPVDVRALYAGDQVTEYLEGVPKPYRVYDIGTAYNAPVYPGSVLMAYGIPQLLGHHGNELRHFDELLGGKNIWTNLKRSPFQVLELYSVNYVITPVLPGGIDSLPGFRRVLSEVTNSAGASVHMFEREQLEPFARVVPAAVKADDDQVVATVADRRFSPTRVVMLAQDAEHTPLEVGELPEPIETTATFTDWRPGRMTLTLAPPPPQDGYVVVGENYYPDWRATVAGDEAPVLRGNGSLITVPVRAGADRVELYFSSADYRRGRGISFVSLAATILLLLVPGVAMVTRRG